MSEYVSYMISHYTLYRSTYLNVSKPFKALLNIQRKPPRIWKQQTKCILLPYTHSKETHFCPVQICYIRDVIQTMQVRLIVVSETMPHSQCFLNEECSPFFISFFHIFLHLIRKTCGNNKFTEQVTQNKLQWIICCILSTD